MATLTNTKIKDTYDGLLKTTDNEALDVSGTTLIEDGLGNASALSVGRVGNGVTVNGLLDVTGEVQGTSLDINGAADISGNLAVDTNTLYVDAANNRVGVGTSSPAANLEVSGNATRLMINTANSAQTVGLLFGLSQSSVASVFSDVSEQNLTFNTGGSSEAMRIDSSGRVSINDTVSGSVATNYNPELLVGGNIVARSLTANAALIEIGGDATSAFITAGKQDGSQTARALRFEVGTSEAMRIDSSGNVSIVGALSKGSGSFKIDHPLEEKKDTHHLVHSFVESPQANNIYRGKVQLLNGSATINLDEESTMTEGTFILLNRDIHTYTSNESDWDAVRGSVEGNILTIECQNSESDAIVSWLVIGERHDQHMYDTSWTDENGKVIVEPLKIIEE